MPHAGVSQLQRLEPAKEKTRLGYAKSRQYGGVLCERRVFITTSRKMYQNQRFENVPGSVLGKLQTGRY